MSLPFAYIKPSTEHETFDEIRLDAYSNALKINVKP